MKLNKNITIALSAVAIFTHVKISAGAELHPSTQATTPAVSCELKPLLPPDARIAMIYSEDGLNASPAAKAVWEKINRLNDESSRRTAEELEEELEDSYPGFKTNCVYKYYQMSSDEIFEYSFGFPKSNIKWAVTSIIPAQVASVKNDFIRCPDFATVIGLGNAIDLAKIYPKAIENCKDTMKHLFPMKRNRDFQAIYNGICDLFGNFSVNEGEYKGAFAIRMTLNNGGIRFSDKVTMPAKRLSPVLTTICSGRLLVFASSEEHLAEIEEIYKGEAKAAPANSEIASAITLADGRIFRFSIVDIIGTVQKFLPEFLAVQIEAAKASGEYETAMLLNSTRNLDIEYRIDAAAEAIAFKWGISFTDNEKAAWVKKTVAPAFQYYKSLFTMQRDENNLTRAIYPIIETMNLNQDGAVVYTGFQASLQDIRNYLEAVVKFKAKLLKKDLRHR